MVGVSCTSESRREEFGLHSCLDVLEGRAGQAGYGGCWSCGGELTVCFEATDESISGGIVGRVCHGYRWL